MTLKLDSPVTGVKGVGAKYAEIFRKNNIVSVLDLLLRFPVLYVDFSKPASILEWGIKQLYRVEILGTSLSRRFKYRGFSILRVRAKMGQETISLVFFNKPYLEEFFKTNKCAYIYGEPEKKNEGNTNGTGEKKDISIWNFNNPVVFTEGNQESVVPAYGKISTIKSGQLKNIMESALENLEDDYECLPALCLEKYGFPGIVDCLKEIHSPSAFIPEVIDNLKKRFIYSEFLFFQLELQFIRDFFKRVPRVNNYKIIPDIKTLVSGSMGFELTPDQETACTDIVGDLQSGFCMQRLLQGDVGSGKTIVAFIALLMAVQNGLQGAFLAPTEILSNQHFADALHFFKDHRIELLTGSTPAKKRKEILKQLKSGEMDIVFGTHALLTESVEFQKLGMVIIDEQHRFGVSQRAALYYKGHAVDLLVTTATPIPRTMLLSIYNDLSVSIIKTKPQGRLPIITRIISPDQRIEFYHKMRSRIEEGEKIYIILPLIEKSDFFAELKDIETESLFYRDIFKGIRIGIVTGRTSPDEKDSILAEFASGEVKALIATTVIEVGIDVKDATIIIIENADRYGLSQLHQLRGRVGRGSAQSYCFLFPSSNLTENGKRRLTTIKETTDGFVIAETDLKMRGGGIISGLEQSGFLDFKVGNLRDDYDTYKNAQYDTVLLLRDPSSRNECISTFLEKIKAKIKDINFS